MLLCLLALPGCGGCGTTEKSAAEKSAEEKRKALEELAKEKAEREKKRDPLEAGISALEPGGRIGSCKPGHWATGFLAKAQANREDFQGELDLQVVTGRDQHLAPLYQSAYEMTSARKVALAKDHPKTLESFFWAPTAMKDCKLETRLAGTSGAELRPPGISLQAMPSYQYFFVVLSAKPARYEFLEKRMDSIRASHDVENKVVFPSQDPKIGNYLVAAMEPKGRPRLPTQALYWTSIAVLLWDDADPGQLDPQQQTALIDWLHWGGRIIVSGPDSLEALRSSFLGPYLPVEAVGTRNLAAADLLELKYWDAEAQSAKPQADEGAPPKALKGWSAITWNVKPAANAVPNTGELVVEQNVGRGAVVVTAFRLSTKELTDWRGCDCFFNACLLRRPPREIVVDNNQTAVLETTRDARFNTGFRLFARDEQREESEYSEVAPARQVVDENGSLSTVYGNSNGNTDVEESSPNEKLPSGPGLAAWNDFGPVPNAARWIFWDASGIRVPDRGFIIKVVAGYLVLLVPLNWLIFRAMGRVEWAWVAAPLIAVGGTVAVIRLAQLNIGFAQSQTEVDIVELHAGYPRAHVTRYMCIYTSLASNYDFHMSDPGGQMMPFPRVRKAGEFKKDPWQTFRTLDCRRGETTDLSGFSVPSNADDLMHCETISDLGGSIVVNKARNGGWSLTNHTKLNLTGCRLLQKSENGIEKFARIVELKDLPPESSTAVNFSAGRTIHISDYETVNPSGKPSGNPLGGANADDTPEAVTTQGLTPPSAPKSPSSGQPSGELKLDKLEEVAMNPSGMRMGAVRLVAHTDARLDGFDVSPAPSAQESRRATLVIVNLDAGKAPEPRPDVVAKNTPLTIQPPETTP
jgi:hypothetical protein